MKRYFTKNGAGYKKVLNKMVKSFYIKGESQSVLNYSCLTIILFDPLWRESF